MENLLNERISTPIGLKKLALVEDISDMTNAINENKRAIQDLHEDFQDEQIIVQDSFKIVNEEMLRVRNVVEPQVEANARAADDLYTKFYDVNGEITSLKNSVSDGKSKVAAAITSKGIDTSATETFDNMANNILAIQSSSLEEDTADGTITSDDVLSGKIGYSQGNRIVGSIPVKSAQVFIPTTTNQSISSGQYLNGTQTILGSSNLVEDNIRKDTTIFNVKGTLIPPGRYIGQSIQYLGGGYFTNDSFTISGNSPIAAYIIRFGIKRTDNTSYYIRLIVAGGCLFRANPSDSDPFEHYYGSFSDIYNVPAASYINTGILNVYFPDISISTNGRTMSLTWSKGKSDRFETDIAGFFWVLK